MERPEDENEYVSIERDGILFYKRKEERPKRRYSNRYRDPVQKIKDTYRKLHLLKKYRKIDYEKEEEIYFEIIFRSLKILQNDYGVQVDNELKMVEELRQTD